MTKVAPRSPLHDQGVRPGCVITEVNGRRVGTGQELDRALEAAKPRSYLRLYVLTFGRNGQTQPFFAVVQAP